MIVASFKKLLRRAVNWMLIAAAALFGIGFAVANRDSVVVRFNPLGEGPLALQLPAMPLFLVVLLSVFVGIVLGCAAGWFSAGGMRRRARQYKRENKSLKREIKSTEPPSSPNPAGTSLPVAVAAHGSGGAANNTTNTSANTSAVSQIIDAR